MESLLTLPAQSGSQGSTHNPLIVFARQLREAYPALRLNQLTGRIQYGPVEQPQELDWLDPLYLKFGCAQGKPLAKSTAIDVARWLAAIRPFNPVYHWLQHCATNAQPSVLFSSLASELLGLSADPDLNPRFQSGPEQGRLMADVIVERFLIAAVHRGAYPGSSQTWMPVFHRTPTYEMEEWLSTLASLGGELELDYTPSAQILHAIPVINPPAQPTQGLAWFTSSSPLFLTKETRGSQLSYFADRFDWLKQHKANELRLPRCWFACGIAQNWEPQLHLKDFALLPVLASGTLNDANHSRCKHFDIRRLRQERMGIWSAAVKAHRNGRPRSFTEKELREMAAVFPQYNFD